MTLSRLLPLLTLLALLAGCSSAGGTGRVILQPEGSTKEFSQKFTQSCAAHNDDGSFEFLLIADDADRSRPKAPGQPLRPTDGPPLRQIVYLKIPWLPMRGNIAETSVANAAIDWYILSDVSESQSDLVHYAGAGYALAYPGGKTITLSLRSARLKPQTVRGALADPLGAFKLTGHLKVLNAPHRLHEMLDALRTRVEAAR